MAVNPQPGLMKPNSWSPNQIAKRNKIVQAASRLMVREGVHACTARMISAECGFSTSSIHYYFKDIDEILDLAIRRVIGRFLRQVENEAALHDDPVQALWAAAHAYFERTSDSIRATDGSGFRHAPMVWFEFQARSLRTGDIQTARDLSSEATQLFVKWMSKIEAITDPVGRADARRGRCLVQPASRPVGRARRALRLREIDPRPHDSCARQADVGRDPVQE